MSATDYLVNITLVGLVVLQVRGRRLTTRMLVLPLVIVVVAAADYLHGVPTAGDNVLLVVLGGVVGAALGTLCGLLTSVRPLGDGAVLAKAGVAAAVLWVLGVGSRLAFELYVTHGGQAAIGRFSAAHHITSAAAWVDCLVLMALAEVVGRTAVLARRAQLARRASPVAPAPAGVPVV